jgi:hypothetical protein
MPPRLTPKERMWRTIPERDIQTTVIEMARRLGYLVFHHHDSRRQVRPGVFVGDRDAKGFPDLVLLRPPRMVVIECKKELGKVEPEQQEWLDAFAACGAEVHVVRPSNMDDVLKAIRPSAQPRAGG